MLDIKTFGGLLLRHALGFLAGGLVAKGLITPDVAGQVVEVGTGAVLTAVTVGMSVYNKKKK